MPVGACACSGLLCDPRVPRPLCRPLLTYNFCAEAARGAGARLSSLGWRPPGARASVRIHHTVCLFRSLATPVPTQLRPPPSSRPRQRAHRKCLERALGVLLLAEFGVHVARQVVGQVLAHAQLLKLAADVGEFLEDVFVEFLKMLLQHILVLRHWLSGVRVVHLGRRHVLQLAERETQQV